MEHYTMGIDVGGTKIAYGLFDENFVLVSKRRHPSDRGAGPEAFFDVIVSNAKEMLAGRRAGLEQLRGIGIGMPSYILYDEGRIIKTSNLTLLRDFPAKDYLQKKFDGKIPVLLDNDTHLAALAEHRLGAGCGYDNMIYCAVSTGIASGIIINGKLFRGTYGWAGETGHMLITPDEGIECGCGNTGCFMSWCSGSMIVRHIQQWIAAGEETLLTEIAGSVENITAAHLDLAFERGDLLAKRAVEQMARFLAVWLFNLYLTLNINCFVLGGGLLAMGDKLFHRVEELFDKYNQDDHPVYFKKAALGDDFGITGAVELFREGR
jgi:glucokinase